MIDPDTDTLARTLYGEARGCGSPGMSHVASVILNRAAHPSWWGHSIVSVCVQPWQFSCRNPGDPNLPKLMAVTAADPAFAVALDIASRAVAGQLSDGTGGADSYYALSMAEPPAWAAKSVKTYEDAWHAFYRTTSTAPPGAAPDVRDTGMSADDLNAQELDILHGDT